MVAFKEIKFSNKWTFLILSAVVLLAYIHSFQGVWFFDDYPNIISNKKLHINDLNLDTLTGTFFSDSHDGGTLYRPLPCLSLALNWYIGQTDVWGYHVVNFVIHVINAFMVFLVIKLLFKTPRLKGYAANASVVYWTALLTAAIWALHPIQIQAVTYIVQRMASMAAMFFIIAIYFFLKACFSESKSLKWRYYILCGVGYACAITSKENTVVLPAVLFLIYWIFFYNGSFSFKYKWILPVIIIFFAAALAGITWYYGFGGGAFKYAERPFNMYERLLTEARIILFYLYQIFWPVPSQFQIEHYISLSTSLISPVTTLMAIIVICFTIILAFVKAARWPIISFAILYYFGCHVVESTVVPLELIFEHRNYIPTMFFILPFTYGFMLLMRYCRQNKPQLYRPMILLACAILFLLGFNTFLRNHVWQDENRLYVAVIEKYPNVSRSYLNISAMIWREISENPDYKSVTFDDMLVTQPEVFEYMKIGVDNNVFYKNDSINKYYMFLALYYLVHREYEEALKMSQQNVVVTPNDRNSHKTLLEIIQKSGMFYTGMAFYADVLKNDPDNFYMHTNLGVLALDTGQADLALDCLQTAVNLPSAAKIGDDDFAVLLRNIAIAYLLKGDYAKARPGFEANLDKTDKESRLAAMWLLGINQMEGLAVEDDLLAKLKATTLKELNASWESVLKIESLPPRFISGLETLLSANLAFNPAAADNDEVVN